MSDLHFSDIEERDDLSRFVSTSEKIVYFLNKAYQRLEEMEEMAKKVGAEHQLCEKKVAELKSALAEIYKYHVKLMGDRK